MAKRRRFEDCSSSSPLSLWPFSTAKEAESCSSNRRPLASVMGALMVADRWPTVRYQPGEPYINRAAPRNKRLAERRKKPKTQRHQVYFWVFLKPHTENEPPLTNTGLKLRKQKRTERELGELEKQSTGTIFQTKAEETEGRKAEVEGEILVY